MSDTIHWIAIGGNPTEAELKSIAEQFGDTLDGDAIISTKEIEPLSKEELIDYFEGVLAELKDE